MSTCGGLGTTAQVNLSSTPVQLVTALESRTRTTVLASQDNDAPVYLTFDPAVGYKSGFPLYPGAAYTLEDRAARVALYGIGPSGGDKTVFVITEGA